MELGLSGRRALVTGGTRGIGRAVALGFARAGARVAVCYREDGEAADQLAKELAAIGGEHVCVAADVSVQADVERLAGVCRDRFGGLDAVVSNAGPITHVPYAELTLDQWRAVVDANLTGAYLVSHTVLPLLSPGSSIVFLGAAVSNVGVPMRAHYTAAKAALSGLTRSLSKELGRKGIRVNTVAPGLVETDQAAGLTPEHRQRYEQMIPLGRLARPEEIANCVLFLSGEAGSYVNGSTLIVDGGI